ncbi:hemerythrin domain-containing protein [Magnetococcales bacterium HHB-1]
MTLVYPELGIVRVDHEHAALGEIFNQVEIMIEERAQKPVIIERLGYLLHQVTWHFRTEEAYMKSVDYPNRVTHIAQHEEFAKYVRRVLVNKRTSYATVLDLFDIQFILAWFLNHIHAYDKPMCRYLAKVNPKLTQTKARSRHLDYTEFRDYTRLYLYLPAELVIISREMKIFGETETLSAAGAFFILTEKKDQACLKKCNLKQQTCILRLRLGFLEHNPTISVEAKVVRLTQQGIGLQYTAMSTTDFNAFKTFLIKHYWDSKKLQQELDVHPVTFLQK